eukprot:3209050-Amphidinium_carterae.1
MQRFVPLLQLERVGPGKLESENGPNAEVQWTRLEKGRMFRNLKLRGRDSAGVVIASLMTSEEGPGI